jgi:hypothetical protein
LEVLRRFHSLIMRLLSMCVKYIITAQGTPASLL